MNRIDATISVAGSGSEQAHPSASGFAGSARGDGVRLHVPAMSESALPDSHLGTTISNLEGLVETLLAPPTPIERELVCDLTYISYATQRELAPEVSPERWAKLFGFTAEGAVAMEKRYQQEQECVEPPIRVNGGDLR